MPSPIVTRLIPILVLSVGLASAAEVEHRVRLGFDMLPTKVDTELSASVSGIGFSAEGKGEYDRSGRMTLQYSARIGDQIAAVVGGGLSFGHSEFENDDGEISEFGGIIEGGVSFRVAPWFDLEAVVPIGFGVASMALGNENANNDDEDFDGGYVDVALLLRPVFTLGTHVQLFGQVGYIVRRESFKDDNDSFDAEFDFEQDGLIAGLGLGVVF